MHCHLYDCPIVFYPLASLAAAWLMWAYIQRP